MAQKIVIVGGGISGCALLHYLSRKYAGCPDIGVTLLEKNAEIGGTIRSLCEDGYLFETGPNGFLDSKPRTLELADALGLAGRLVKADEQAKIRYLSCEGGLHPLPNSFLSFLSFPLLNPFEKMRILGEIFVPRGRDPRESVYDFGKRRLGEKFARVFLDPMVSGVYGGDARQTNLKTVFPRIYQLEQEYGSLFRAMLSLRKSKKSRGREKARQSFAAGPGGTLTSFRGGVRELIGAIQERYRDHIVFAKDVACISKKDQRYVAVCADGERVEADHLYLCAPAYASAGMVSGLDDELSRALDQVYYAPMAVLGFAFDREDLGNIPQGYGYLIPSSENKEVLGVLFESNIFPDRCPQGQILFRVMIGGARHPDILKKSREEMVFLGLSEIASLAGNGESAAGLQKKLKKLFFVPWERAIPQYDRVYAAALPMITQRVSLHPGLHLAANYLNGVSMNDCVESAFQAGEKGSL